MAYTFTRTGAQIEEIHNTVEDPKSNTQFSDDIRTIAGEYRGLWPDTGGSANKGDTYQTQVSGTPTGQYFTALKNTTVDPIGDDVNWRSVASEQWVADNFSNTNLLSNHNFLIQTPDDSQPLPSSTPTSYPPGYQIFSGVFANETTGISNLTYIDGRVSFSGGDLYFAVPNTGGLERLNTDQFVASVADFNGKPSTRGVSFALVGDEYRVTVGIDALSDGVNGTLLGSVKFEQGKVATGHELQSKKGQIYNFDSVAQAVANCPVIGSRIVIDDYYGGATPSNSGALFFKVVPAGTGANDGGKYIDVDATRQLEQNLTTVVNPKQWGAVGGGVINDADSISNAIAYWRLKVLALKRPKLEFPPDVYLCSGASWNFTGLGTAASLIEGNNSIIEFEDLGNTPSVWDWTDSKEITAQNIKIRYGGDFNRPEAECPFVGLLFARNASNDFSGRHRTYNVYITGTYQTAAFYNSGTEENTHYNPEFRNNLEGKRCHVLTCSNDLGVTSEYSSITTSAISTTLNTYIRPAFYTDGASREAVAIRGAGGVTMVNPYSSCGGFSHYSIQAKDQSISAVRFIGYQAEQDRGSLQTNAAHVIRFEGDGTLDITGCTFDEQFSTTTGSEVLIETVRNFKRVDIKTGGALESSGITTSVTGCDISASLGVDLDSVTNVSSSSVYASARSSISLPNNSKSVTVTTDDLDSPVIVGKVKQQATSGTVNLDEALIGFSGGGTINNFSSDFSGLPFIAQRLYGYCVSASMTIANKGGGTGNIRTENGSDMVLSANQYVEITYQGHSDKYYVRLMND